MLAVENIRAAITGRPPRAYAEVAAEDVVAAGESIPPERRTRTTEALVAGARAALAGGGNPDLTVHQIAGQLAELAEKAGA